MVLVSPLPLRTCTCGRRFCFVSSFRVWFVFRPWSFWFARAACVFVSSRFCFFVSFALLRVCAGGVLFRFLFRSVFGVCFFLALVGLHMWPAILLRPVWQVRWMVSSGSISLGDLVCLYLNYAVCSRRRPPIIVHCFRIADFWHCRKWILVFLGRKPVIWHDWWLHFGVLADLGLILGHWAA